MQCGAVDLTRSLEVHGANRVVVARGSIVIRFLTAVAGVVQEICRSRRGYQPVHRSQDVGVRGVGWALKVIAENHLVFFVIAAIRQELCHVVDIAVAAAQFVAAACVVDADEQGFLDGSAVHGVLFSWSFSLARLLLP